MSVRVDLAYEFVVRALDEQRRTLDSTRTRAGLMLGLAAVVNVELGRLALASGATPAIAFAAGGGVLAAVGVFLLGRLCLPKELRLYPPAVSLMDPGTSLASLDEKLVKGTLVDAMERNRKWNEQTIRDLEYLLKAAMTALVLSAACWLIAIATRG